MKWRIKSKCQLPLCPSHVFSTLIMPGTVLQDSRRFLTRFPCGILRCLILQQKPDRLKMSGPHNRASIAATLNTWRAPEKPKPFIALNRLKDFLWIIWPKMTNSRLALERLSTGLNEQSYHHSLQLLFPGLETWRTLHIPHHLPLQRVRPNPISTPYPSPSPLFWSGKGKG